MRGGGAMLAFDLVGATATSANRFMRGLEVATPARSLGGCHTTVAESARAHSYYSISTGTQIGVPSAVPFLTPASKSVLYTLCIVSKSVSYTLRNVKKFLRDSM